MERPLPRVLSTTRTVARPARTSMHVLAWAVPAGPAANADSPCPLLDAADQNCARIDQRDECAVRSVTVRSPLD